VCGFRCHRAEETTSEASTEPPVLDEKSSFGGAIASERERGGTTDDLTLGGNP
jgi:hypothetical protein